MAIDARPRSHVPTIKRVPDAAQDLADLAALIGGESGLVIAGLVCSAASCLKATPDDALLIIALMWLADQIPPITSEAQCGAYQAQLAAIAGKAEAANVPLSRYARTIEGLLAAPTLIRIQEWTVTKKRG